MMSTILDDETDFSLFGLIRCGDAERPKSMKLLKLMLLSTRHLSDIDYLTTFIS